MRFRKVGCKRRHVLPLLGYSDDIGIAGLYRERIVIAA